MTNYQRVTAEINLDNLAYNIRNIKNRAGNKKVLAVVKADAYGHGAVEAAKVCLFNGAEYLAVANCDEGVNLRANNITAPILILGYTFSGNLKTVIKNNIAQTVYSRETADEISREALSLNMTCKIHIKIDTGMGRLGFLPNEKSIEEIMYISRLPGIFIEGIFTHFAEADSADKNYTLLQAERFAYVCNALEERGLKLIRHCANSAAILDMLPGLGCDMVRAGIILYGCYPSEEVSRSVDIKPVMSLKARIAYVKTLTAGSPVSYGRTFTAKRDMRVATVPVGYADGYMRCLSNKARVIVKGAYAPVIGRVCMDQFMIDVSEIPSVEMGDQVILLGEEAGLKIDADELARLANTISYEVLCAVSKRVPRLYIKEGKPVKTINYIKMA
ncbi:MAG: alanine racemase [Clostridiales bacterium]|nr:alanine racemase [Clostridiales bacterium]